MKVMVTGGTGFLGGALCKELKKRQYQVSTIARSKAADLEKNGIEVFYGDLTDKDFVEKSLSGLDSVIHAAGKPGVWGPYEDYYKNNVVGTENIISGCLKNKIKSLIFTSSPSVVFDLKDQNGVNEKEPYLESYKAHYPKTKAIAEQLVLKANSGTLATVALRPHLIWGPGDRHLVPRLISRAKIGKMLLIDSGKNIIDTTYIDNAVHGHILAMEKLSPGSNISGKKYFITNGEPMPTADILNAMLKEANLPKLTKSVPQWAAYTTGAMLEFLYTIAGRKDEPIITRFVAKELACSHWFDISAAQKDLGYEPLVSMDNGLKLLGKWLRQNGLL